MNCAIYTRVSTDNQAEVRYDFLYFMKRMGVSQREALARKNYALILFSLFKKYPNSHLNPKNVF